MRTKILSRVNLFLFVIFLFGVVLLFMSHFLAAESLWREFAGGFGIAFIIAGILGMTVDAALKQGLVKDAVKAAIGYILPDELKDEMRWISEFDFLAVEHVANYRLTVNLSDSTVTIREEIRRRFRNITDGHKSLSIGTSIDDWGIPGRPSRIQRVAYQTDTQPWVALDTKNVREDAGALVLNSPEDLRVPSKGEVEVETICEEVKRLNDDHHIAFGYPTWHPRVIVSSDASLQWRIAFGHRKQAEIKSNPDGGGYRLTGTLLPQQRIVLRWWPSERQEATRVK